MATRVSHDNPPRPRPDRFERLPPAAAFRHREARDGFEVVYCEPHEDGARVEGHTTAVEEGESWSVRYTIEVDGGSRTRHAAVVVRSRAGERAVRLERAEEARWRVNGHPAPHLDGCLDVDLEASAFTNALPVRRLRLEVGEEADAPAAYVRALDLAVERLAQRYRRLDAGPGVERYWYESPAFGFACELAYDPSGVILDYPGIGRRVV